MPVPDYETMMLPLLRSFAHGATSVKDCLPDIAREFSLTEEEQSELLPSGTTTVLSSRAHWARTYMSKAGLLRSPRRGRHDITDRGRDLLRQSPGKIDNALLRQRYADFDEWVSNARRKDSGTAPTTQGVTQGAESANSPDERMDLAFREIESALEEELLSVLHAMDPTAFERLVLKLLQAMGYGGGSLGARMTTKATGDGGIDGIIHEDALGLDAVYVQAKRYAPETKVGRPALQQFVGSLTGEGATKGVFVTTSAFSGEAVDFLRRVQHRIVLIDGRHFARLMIRHDIGVRVSRTYLVKAVDENVFADV
jgi:restriction system protein